MARKHATCNIEMTAGMAAKPVRRRAGQMHVEIVTSQAMDAPKPITLRIKGGNLARVMELMSAYQQTDSELAQKVRASVLASEVEGMTTEEVANWARGSILDELGEMAG